MAENKQMNSYDLSRAWFDWCFENPEKISPNHHAIFFFAIEHCNRLGWKEKFGFPTQMVMDAIGIKKHETYIRYFLDLCSWGFLNIIQRSVNQYSANIISLGSAMPKNGKALGKAILSHMGKQTQPIGESNRSINKPITINKEPLNSEPEKIEDLSELEIEYQITQMIVPSILKVWKEKNPNYFSHLETDSHAALQISYNIAAANGWKKSHILKYKEKECVESFDKIATWIMADNFWSDKTLEMIAKTNNWQKIMNGMNKRTQEPILVIPMKPKYNIEEQMKKYN